MHALPWAALKDDFIKKEQYHEEEQTKTDNRKKETLYHSRIQLSFSCSFSAQLIFAEVLGSELMFLRFFFSYFLGVVLIQECSFFLALFDLGFQNGVQECIVYTSARAFQRVDS